MNTILIIIHISFSAYRTRVLHIRDPYCFFLQVIRWASTGTCMSDNILALAKLYLSVQYRRMATEQYVYFFIMFTQPVSKYTHCGTFVDADAVQSISGRLLHYLKSNLQIFLRFLKPPNGWQVVRIQITHVSEIVKLNLFYPGTGFRIVLVVSMIF